MSMNDLDLLSDKYIPENWDVADHRGEDALIIEHFDRQVVDFQPVCHVSNSLAIPIRMSNYDDFVSSG